MMSKANLKMVAVPDEDGTFFIIKVSVEYEKLFMDAISDIETEIAQNEAEIGISQDEDKAFMEYLERKSESPFDQYPDEGDYYPDNVEDEDEQIDPEMYNYYEDEGLDEKFEGEI